MKKTILNLVSIIILISMLFTLTGCGNNEIVEQNDNEDKKTSLFEKEEKITAENYGDKINYSANGIDDWKIFYNDGENIFIITSSLIPNSKVQDSIGLESRKNKYLGNYNVIWDWDNPEFTKYSGANSIDIDLAKKYQLEWIERHPDGTNLNMNVVASLLDENNWSAFVDSNYAESAIGSPTLEMFVKSWNEKYPNRKLYYCDGEYGYCIGEQENPTTNGVYGIEELKQDKLYNIAPEQLTDDGSGFTLASPNARGEDRVCSVGKSNVSLRDPFGDYEGVRPVVCLKSDVKLKNENGVWIIEGKSRNNNQQTQEKQPKENTVTKANTTTSNDTNINLSNTNSQVTEITEELKVGNTTIKYGTYTGIDAATGDILVINKDGTATLNGTSYTYGVDVYNFAQDSSSPSYKEGIIFINDNGETAFSLYVASDGSLKDDPMGYIYSGN